MEDKKTSDESNQREADESRDREGAIDEQVAYKLKRNHLKNNPKKANVQVAQLAARGMTATEITKITGIPERTVCNHLKAFRKVFKALDDAPDYEKNKSQILSAVELKLLQSMMSESKLKKANLNGLAYAFKQAHDANRLTKGLSTSNVATANRFFGPAPLLPDQMPVVSENQKTQTEKDEAIEVLPDPPSSK